MENTRSLYGSPLNKIQGLKPARSADQERLQKLSSDPRPHPVVLAEAVEKVREIRLD